MYRVLLVDDEQIERMALAKKIDRYYGDKVDIYHAVNGREAVAMCGEQKNDIVIMDISMPEMNGVMAAKYIRKMDDECSIIFLSAYDDFEYARNAIKVRALDYLLKPCDMNDLLAVMDTALQKLDKENAFNGNSISGKEQNKETQIDGSNYNNVRENRPKRTDNVRNSDEQTTIKYLKEYVENNYIYDISMPEKKDGSLSDDHEKSQDYKDEAPRYISLSDCNRDRFETGSFHAPLQGGNSAQWHRNSLYP